MTLHVHIFSDRMHAKLKIVSRVGRGSLTLTLIIGSHRRPALMYSCNRFRQKENGGSNGPPTLWLMLYAYNTESGQARCVTLELSSFCGAIRYLEMLSVGVD